MQIDKYIQMQISFYIIVIINSFSICVHRYVKYLIKRIGDE